MFQRVSITLGRFNNTVTGLATLKKLVENIGGTIAAYSKNQRWIKICVYYYQVKFSFYKDEKSELFVSALSKSNLFLCFMRPLLFSVIAILGFLNPVFSQIGGNNTYEFLNLVPSARIAAIGGEGIAIYDHDVNMAFRNPALLNVAMDQHLSLNVVSFFDGISYGSASYAYKHQKYGMVGLGARYITYGNFEETDPNGAIIGNFNAGEYALQASWAYELDSNWSVGVSSKAIFSSIASYTSFGMAVDAGLVYHKAASKFAAALLVKNIGLQFKTYNGDQEPLPFEIQMGISKRLKYMPLRWTLTMQQLQKLDLTFKDPNAGGFDPFTGDPIPEDYSLGHKVLRHVVIGAEFLPESNFTIRYGINYRRRQELKVEPFKKSVGHGFGVGLKIAKFHFNYARSRFHLAGVSNHISITVNLEDFYTRK